MLMNVSLGVACFIFLPAAVVSALNVGFAICFTAIMRSYRSGKKKYTFAAWCALATVVVGCGIIAFEHYIYGLQTDPTMKKLELGEQIKKRKENDF